MTVNKTEMGGRRIWNGYTDENSSYNVKMVLTGGGLPYLEYQMKCAENLRNTSFVSYIVERQ